MVMRVGRTNGQADRRTDRRPSDRHIPCMWIITEPEKQSYCIARNVAKTYGKCRETFNTRTAHTQRHFLWWDGGIPSPHSFTSFNVSKAVRPNCAAKTIWIRLYSVYTVLYMLENNKFANNSFMKCANREIDVQAAGQSKCRMSGVLSIFRNGCNRPIK